MAYGDGFNLCCNNDGQCADNEFCAYDGGCQAPDWFNGEDSFDFGDIQIIANGGQCRPIPSNAILEVRWPNPFIVKNPNNGGYNYDMHPGGISDPNEFGFYPPWFTGNGVNYADKCNGLYNSCNHNGSGLGATMNASLRRGYPEVWQEYVANKKVQDYWIGVNEACYNNGVFDEGGDCDRESILQYWEMGILGWNHYIESNSDWRRNFGCMRAHNTWMSGRMDEYKTGMGFPSPQFPERAASNCNRDVNDIENYDGVNEDQSHGFPYAEVLGYANPEDDMLMFGSCAEIFQNWDELYTGRQPDGSAGDRWDNYLDPYDWPYEYGIDNGWSADESGASFVVAGCGKGDVGDGMFGNYGTGDGSFTCGNGDYYKPGHCAWGNLDQSASGGGCQTTDEGWVIFPQWGMFGIIADEFEYEVSEGYLNDLVRPTYAGKLCYRGWLNSGESKRHSSGKIAYWEVRVGNGWKYIIEMLGQIPGCMDPDANNYDPSATVDDGSCDFQGSGDDDYDTGGTGDIDVCPDISAMNFGAAGGGSYQGWEGTDHDTEHCHYLTCLHPLADNFLIAQGAHDGPRFLSLDMIRSIFEDEDFSKISPGPCEFNFTDDPIGFIDVQKLWRTENKTHHPYGNWDSNWMTKWQSPYGDDNIQPGDGWPYLYLEVGGTSYAQYSEDVGAHVWESDYGYGVITSGLWGGNLKFWDTPLEYAEFASQHGGQNVGPGLSARQYIELGNTTISNPDQGNYHFGQDMEDVSQVDGTLFEEDDTTLINRRRFGPHSVSPAVKVLTEEKATDDEYKLSGYMHQWYFNNTADKIDFTKTNSSMDFSYSGFSLNFKSKWFSQIGRFLHGAQEFENVYDGGSSRHYTDSYVQQGGPPIPLGGYLSDHYKNFRPLGQFDDVKGYALNPETIFYDSPGLGGIYRTVEQIWDTKGLKNHPCANYDPYLNCSIFWDDGEYIVIQGDGDLNLDTITNRNAPTGDGLSNNNFGLCEDFDIVGYEGDDHKRYWPRNRSGGFSSWYDIKSPAIHEGMTHAWTDFNALDTFLTKVADIGGDMWENYRPIDPSGFRYFISGAEDLKYGDLCDASGQLYNPNGNWGQSGGGKCHNDEWKVEDGWSPLFDPGYVATEEESNTYNGTPDNASMQFIYRFNPSELFSREHFCNPFNDFLQEGSDLWDINYNTQSMTEFEALYKPTSDWNDYIEHVYGTAAAAGSIQMYHKTTPYLRPSSYMNYYEGNWWDLNQEYFQTPSGHPSGKYLGLPVHIGFQMHFPNIIHSDNINDIIGNNELSNDQSELVGLMTGNTDGLFEFGHVAGAHAGSTRMLPSPYVDDEGNPMFSCMINIKKKVNPINITLVNNHPNYGCNSFDFEESIYDDILLSVFEPYDDLTYEYISGFNCEDGSSCNKFLLYENDEASILSGTDVDDYTDVSNDGRFYGVEKTFTFDSPWPTNFNLIPQIRLIVEDSECNEGGFKVFFNNIDLTNQFASVVGGLNAPSQTDGNGLCQGYQTETRQHTPFVYTSGFIYYDDVLSAYRKFDTSSPLQYGQNQLKIVANSSIILKKVEVFITENVYGNVFPLNICADGSRCGVSKLDTLYECPTQFGPSEYFPTMEICHQNTSCNYHNVPCRAESGFAEMSAVNGWGLVYDTSLAPEIWGDNDSWITRCWSAGHCNNGYGDNGNFSLTSDGLTTYEYKISPDVDASTNILAPRERITNVVSSTPVALFDDILSDIMSVDTLVNLNLNVPLSDTTTNSIVDLTQNHSNFTFTNDNIEQNDLFEWPFEQNSHFGTNEYSLRFVPENMSVSGDGDSTSVGTMNVGGTYVMGNPNFGTTNHRNKVTIDYWIRNNYIGDYDVGIPKMWTQPNNSIQYHFSLFQNENQKRPIFALGIKNENLFVWDDWGSGWNLQDNAREIINPQTGTPVTLGNGGLAIFKNIRLVFTPTAGNALEYTIYLNDISIYTSLLPFEFPLDTRWFLGGAPISSNDRQSLLTNNSADRHTQWNFSGEISAFTQKVHRISTEDFMLQGFRDSNNNCCDAQNFDCIESLQTRFNLNNFSKAANNLYSTYESQFGFNHTAHSSYESTGEGGPDTGIPIPLIGGSSEGLGLIKGGDDTQGIRFGFKFKVGDFFSGGDEDMEDYVLKKNTEYTISTYIYIPEDLPLNNEVQWCLDGDEDHEPNWGYPSDCGELGWTGDGETSPYTIQSPRNTDWDYLYCTDDELEELCGWDGAPTCDQDGEAGCVLGPGLRTYTDAVRVGQFGGDYMYDIPEDLYTQNPNLLNFGILESFRITNSTSARFSPTYRGRWQRISFTFKTADQNSHGEYMHIVWNMNGGTNGGGNQSKNRLGYKNENQYFYTFGAQLEQGSSLGFYNPIMDLNEYGITIPQGHYLTFLDMNILNSPLQVCEGDKWLMNLERGFGSDSYDVTITNQPTDNNIHETTQPIAPDLLEYNGYNKPARYFVDDLYRTDTELVFRMTRDFKDFDWTYSTPPSVLSSPIPIRIKGANIPKLQTLEIEDVSIKPQIGVQVRDNEQQIIEYDNIGKTIIESGELDVTYTSITYPDSTIDDTTGVKAVGYIDFSTFELATETPEIHIKVNGNRISNDFSSSETLGENDTLPVWEQIVQAITEYVNPFTGLNEYRAYYDPSSDTNPDSNLKKIIVEANYVGEEYNGEINWTLPDEYTVLGGMGEYRQPRFISLQNGKKYPIVHLYEDFGTVDFSIVASDVDAAANIFFQTATDRPNNFRATINNYTMDSNPLGDTSNIGGLDTPNLVTDSQVEGAGESIARATLSVETYGGSSEILSTLNPSIDSEENSWVLDDITYPYDGVTLEYVSAWEFDINEKVPGGMGDGMQNVAAPHYLKHNFEATVGEYYRYSFKIQSLDRSVIMVSLGNGVDRDSGFYAWSGQRGAETTYNISSLTATERLQTDGDGNPISSLNNYTIRELPSGEIFIEGIVFADGNPQQIEGAETIMPGETFEATFMIYLGIESFESDDFGIQSNSEGVPEYESQLNVNGVRVSNLSFVNNEYESTLEPNFVGDTRVILRTMDETTMTDLTEFIIRTHPVNDKPVVTAASDTEIYLNNSKYPTDINIELETADVENVDGTRQLDLLSFDIIDEDYCNRVKESVEFFSDLSVTYKDVVYSCKEMRFCTTLCSEVSGMTKEETEKECSFSNFLGRSIISSADYLACEDSRVDTDNDRDETSFAETIEFKGSNNLPNFLNEAKVDDLKTDIEMEDDDVNLDRIKKYVHIVPKENITGSFSARIGIEDDGINEDGEFSQIRTGYSVVNVDVGGVNMSGPEGELFTLETATFGIIPDTYQYFAKGNDVRPTIPTHIEKDFDITLYKYERENERIISYCDIMPNTFINSFGQCCSTVPINQNYKDYFNHSKEYYYKQEYIDEINLFFNYFRKNSADTKWCDASIDTIDFNFIGQTPSNNQGGYLTPNIEINSLDHVVSYRFEIIDLVENYYSIPEDEEWWNELWEEDWLNTWTRLNNEGFNTEGENEFFGKILYQAGPFTHQANNLSKIINEGFIYRFDYPSIYKVSVYATDTYGFTGETFEIVDARNIIKLNQTTEGRYNPWQGWNILGTTDDVPVNKEASIEDRDKDKRPSLGLWYYEELVGNKQKDWYSLHTDSFKNLEGNFTGSFSTKYNTDLEKVEANNNIGFYQGKVVNELAFSNNFRNAESKVSEEHFYQNESLFNSIGYLNYVDFQQSEYVTLPNIYIQENDTTNSNLRPDMWTEFDKILDVDSIHLTEKVDTGAPIQNYWRMKTRKLVDALANKSLCALSDNERQSAVYDDVLSPYEYLPQYYFSTYDSENLGLINLFADADDCETHCHIRDKHLRDNAWDDNDNWRDILNLHPTEYPYATSPCIYQGWERIWNVYYWHYGTFFSNLNLFPDFWSEANAWYHSYWNSYYVAYDCLLSGQMHYRILDNPFHSFQQILDGDISYVQDALLGAKQECENECYIQYNTFADSNLETNYCRTIEEFTSDDGVPQGPAGQWITNFVDTNNKYPKLSQVKIFNDDEKLLTDRIFSVFLRKPLGISTNSKTFTLRVEKLKVDGTSEITDRFVRFTDTGDINEESMRVENGSAIYNLEDDNIYPIGSDYTLWHPDYPFIIPMWSYYNLPDNWFRFLSRIEFDETDTGYIFSLIPESVNPLNMIYNEYSMDIFNAQVEKIEPYKELIQPVQETFLSSLVKPYDFIPDVDVRSPLSAGGSKSVMYKYYDEELQPDAYQETSAPAKAQLFFYIRDPYEKDVFASKQIMEYPNNSLYVAFLDWGDGSKIEYDKEPFEMTDNKTLDHIYEDSGVYEIKGEMFNVARNIDNEVLGIGTFKEFLIRINISQDYEIENEFKQLGGSGYSFIPYKDTVPIISGISNKSFYFKKIKRTLGYIENKDGSTIKVKSSFKSWTDEMKTELALAQVDDSIIGPKLSAMTGSVANESSLVSDDDNIVLSTEGANCAFNSELEMYVCNMLGSPNDGLTYPTLEECKDECAMLLGADRIRGFYDGVVDSTTGEIVGENKNYTDYDGTTRLNTMKPKIINKGSGTNFGEMGEWTGNTDFGQIRYFDTPIDMWEFLGVDGNNINHPNNPESLLYWNNIIPKDVSLAEREGVFKEKTADFSDNSGEYLIQFYGIGQSGLSFDVMFGDWNTQVENGQVGPLYTYNNDTSLGQLEQVSSNDLIFSANNVCDFSVGDEEWILNHCFGQPGNPQINRFYYFTIPTNSNFSYTNDNYKIWKCESGGSFEDCEYLLQMGDMDGYNECIETKCFSGTSTEVNYITDNKVTSINEDSHQNWIRKNKYNTNYYYPVLPKLNKLGKFEFDGLGLQSNVDKQFGAIIDVNDILNPIYFEYPINGLQFIQYKTFGDTTIISAKYQFLPGNGSWVNTMGDDETKTDIDRSELLNRSDSQWVLLCDDDRQMLPDSYDGCTQLVENNGQELYMNFYKNIVVGKIVIINQEELSFKLQPPSFYGQKELWNSDDKLSAVTLESVPPEYAGNAILDLDVSEISQKSLSNKGVENSTGVTFEDFTVKFNEKDSKPKKQKPKPDLSIGKNKKKGQF